MFAARIVRSGNSLDHYNVRAAEDHADGIVGVGALVVGSSFLPKDELES